MSPVFPVVLAGFTAFLDLYATQPLLPLLMRVFGASHGAVSFTITAATIAVALASPIVGRVADRVGRKRVIVVSACALTLATIGCATAPGLWTFVFWRFVQGLFTPGVFTVVIAYIHEEYPLSYAGRASAAYVSGTVLGGFCGRVLVGVIAARYTWHWAFAALAVANLAAALALARWLPREQGRHSRLATSARAGHGLVAWRLLRNPRLAATNAGGFCVLFTLVAMFTYVSFYLEAPPFSLSTAALGSLFVVYLFGAAVTPIAGRWVDQHGHRAGLALGMVGGGVGSLLTLTSTLPSILAGLALVGAGVFVAQSAASSYIGHVTKEDRGLAVGLYSTAYYLGGTLGGGLPSLFWDASGWTACVLLVLAVQVVTLGIGLHYWEPVEPVHA